VDEGWRPPCGAIEIGTNSINPCSEGCARFCRESTAMHTLADWVDQSSLTRLTATFVLVILAAVVSHLVKRHLWRTFVSGAETRFNFQYETLLLIPRIVGSVVWLVVALIILGLWGLDVSGIWALLISAAAVIGVGFLAVWTIVSNITASLFLSVWRPFKLGQTVEVLPENLKGRVIDRNLMFTVLRDGEDRVLQVPNNFFFQKMFWVTDTQARSLFEVLERGSQSRDHTIDLSAR
jgi:small-conductance mechanosensitive channel